MTFNFPYPIMFVDDEADQLTAYENILLLNGISDILLMNESREVMPLLRKKKVSAVVLDLYMPHMDGRELLGNIKNEFPGLPVIIVTGSDKINDAVGCMKDGAFDYLLKPVNSTRLLTALAHCHELSSLMDEVSLLKKTVLAAGLNRPELFSEIITTDEKMQAGFKYMEALAPSNRPILITGESGTGKELFARAVHTLSERQGKLVTVNIAGLDDAFFSDTLFGHTKGAFTGADSRRDGLIFQAEAGTLFLDEIGDLELSSQVKLLRLLQEGSFYRTGSDKPEFSSARIVAATNVDLKQQLKEGKFRQDLYYRLFSHNINIPSLRERKTDIPLLTNHFIEKSCRELEKPIPRVPEELYTLLSTYPFPGNVRELEGLVYDAVSRNTSQTLSLSRFKEYLKIQAVGNIKPGETEKNTEPPNSCRISYKGPFPPLKVVEEYFIREAMKLAGGKQSIAATLLGVSPSTLSKRFKREDSHPH